MTTCSGGQEKQGRWVGGWAAGGGRRAAESSLGPGCLLLLRPEPNKVQYVARAAVRPPQAPFVARCGAGAQELESDAG